MADPAKTEAKAEERMVWVTAPITLHGPDKVVTPPGMAVQVPESEVKRLVDRFGAKRAKAPTG